MSDRTALFVFASVLVIALVGACFTSVAQAESESTAPGQADRDRQGLVHTAAVPRPAVASSPRPWPTALRRPA